MPESMVQRVMKRMMTIETEEEMRMSRFDEIKRNTLDANVVLRYIMRDNVAQYKKVRRLLLDLDTDYYIDDMAISEIIYVLMGKTYQLSRYDAVRSVKNFLEIVNVCCHNRGLISDALDMFVEHPKLSFNDCYLSVKAMYAREEPLWTFDAALAKQSGTAKLL